MKIASFDLEIAKVLDPENKDFISQGPLGITCAACQLEGEVLYWQGRPRMTQQQCQELVSDLQGLVQQGYSLLTWNGMYFDFQVLAQESGLYEECAELALNHIDLMLIVTFSKGWFVGLQSALEGMGLAGKLKSVRLSDGTIIDDMGGDKAPSFWEKGEYEAVLDYLEQDVLQPYLLTKKILSHGHLRWFSKKGKAQFLNIPRLLTVRECFDIPEPDVNWMTDPPRREQFIEWAQKHLKHDFFEKV